MLTVRHPKQLGLLLALLFLWSSVVQAQYVTPADPLTRGLVAWYLAPPGLGGGLRWYDLLGRAHGTLTNGASWAPSTRPGGWYEVRLDGVDDVVTVAANAALEPPERTQAFWAKIAGTGPDYQSLVGYQHATNYFNSYFRPGTPDHYLAVYYTTTTGSNAIDTAAGLTIPAQTWVHLAVTFGGGVIRTYRNCQLNQTATPGGTLVASGAPLLIGGATSGTAASVQAAFEDVRLYDRALTAQELCAVMRQRPPLRTSTSLALLPPSAQGSLLQLFQPPAQ